MQIRLSLQIRSCYRRQVFFNKSVLITSSWKGFILASYKIDVGTRTTNSFTQTGDIYFPLWNKIYIL
jgi:hypothetical protein